MQFILKSENANIRNISSKASNYCVFGLDFAFKFCGNNLFNLVVVTNVRIWKVSKWYLIEKKNKKKKKV